MPSFSVLTRKEGVTNRMPSVLMSDAFISDESRGIHAMDGEYTSFWQRYKTLYDADGEKAACPTAVHAVTAVSTGDKKFTIAGNHASTIGATIRINGSTGNDALYTVSDASDAGGNTEITVTETVADATVDGNVLVGGTQILRYHLYTDIASGTEYLLLATAYHILLWTESAKTLTVKFTCTTPANVTRWSIVSHRGDVYASNNDDKVQVWDADSNPSNAFAPVNGVDGIDLGGGSYCTKAKYLATFEGYLFVANLTIDGNVKAQTVWWDDATGSDDFTTGDASERVMMTNAAAISGVAIMGTDIFFFRTEGAATRGYLVSSSLIFHWVDYPLELGCPCDNTLIRVPQGDIYWLADDMSFRSLVTGKKVMQQINKTLRKINRKYIHLASCAFMADHNALLLAIPYEDSTVNNLVIEYHLDDGHVYLHDLSVVAFGGWYAQAAMTIDGLDVLYDTIEDWGAAQATIDAEAAREGMKLLLVADSSGYTYEMRDSVSDDSEDATSTLVFDTHLRTIHEYKRLNDGIELIVKRQSSGTVYLYVKEDGTADYTLVGSGSMADASIPEYVRLWIPCDKRAKHFRFKIETTAYLAFIAMTFRNFEFDGET